MTSTTFLTEKVQTLLQPDEDLMLEREGRDRRALRRELMPTTEMADGERYVEEGDGMYVSPDTSMPATDTSVGEALGNVQIERYTGDQVRVPRMTHGMTLDVEDMNIDGAEDEVQRARDAVMELFDIQADIQALNGVTDVQGNQVQPSLTGWLDNNIPADNVIDASSGDYDEYRLGGTNGNPANIILQTAYSKTTGEYADDGWDYAMWQHDTAALWNAIDNNSGAVQKSLWLDLESDSAGVGQSVVNDAVTIPKKTGLRTAPDQNDSLRFDYTFPDDTMYLIPDHRGDFFENYEQSGPALIDEPIRKNGGKVEYEYYWRAGPAFGFGSHRNDDGSGDGVALDAVKIENVSSLFN